MDICFDCKKKTELKTIMLCEMCDDKLKEQIKKKMMEKYNGRSKSKHKLISSYRHAESKTRYYLT